MARKSMQIAIVLACLLVVSHGWRVQTSSEGRKTLKEETDRSPDLPVTGLVAAFNPTNAFNPSVPGAASRVLSHPISSARPAAAAAAASVRRAPVAPAARSAPAHIEAPAGSQAIDASTQRNAPSPKMLDRATESQASVALNEPAVDSLPPEKKSASQVSTAPVQASASKAWGETLWWSKILGARWAMFAGIAALFSKLKLFQPPPSAEGARSGTVTASEGYDVSLIDKRDFTDDEREFFKSRTRMPSKREILLGRGWGAILLVGVTILSLNLANGRDAREYCNFWEKVVGFGPQSWQLWMPLHGWVSEAFMSFFFFLVGLEIKREYLFGSLRDIRAAALPCAAALGGMVVPTVIYCIIQDMTGSPLRGWAVPMATDIAFALGIYNVFRKRMPAGLGAFLLTFATVDDIGAIAVIAIAFAKKIEMFFLGGAALCCFALDNLRKERCRKSRYWLATGAALWYCLLRGGVNPDIAGVIAAFFIPTVAAPRYTKAQGELPNLIDHYAHFWTGWSNFLIMPLFAMANTALYLPSGTGSLMRTPVARGILWGLLLGKPLGIAGASLLSIELGWCKWPTGMRPVHLGICGLLGAIAFTMSLFLIEQSLVGWEAMAAKLAVMSGSAIAAIAAAVWMSNLEDDEDEK